MANSTEWPEDSGSQPRWSFGTLIVLLWLLSAIFGVGSDVFSSSIPGRALISDASGSELFAKINAKNQIDRELGKVWNEIDAGEKAVDYLKRITPLFTWVNLCGALSTRESAFLLASCASAQWGELIFMSPREFAAAYGGAIVRVGSFSKLDAISFVKILHSSSSDKIVMNSFCLLQLSSLLMSIVYLPIRFGIKWSFIVTLAIGVAFSVATFLWRGSPGWFAVANLGTIYGLGSNALAVTFAGILVWRWARQKAAPAVTGSFEKLRAFAQSRHAKEYDVARWDALVKYDEEIATAVAQLRPHGDAVVDECAKAFFALGEDRRYLPNIVARLVGEAKNNSRELNEGQGAAPT